MKNKIQTKSSKNYNKVNKKNRTSIAIDVSFIIVSYNTKDYLIDCIKSIYDTNERLKFEIIVVDNSSKDGSPEAVQKYFPDVILINESENHGFAKANNIGMKKAKGKYICLVNSDVKILPRSMRKLYDYIKQQPAIGMIAPKTLNGDGTLQKAVWKFPSIRRVVFATFGIQFIFPKLGVEYGEIRQIQEVDCLAGSFWLIPQETLIKVGLLDERFFFYGEDIDWCKRFHIAGYKVILYPFAEIIHYGGVSYCGSPNAHNAVPVKYKILQDKAQIDYWRKHYGASGKFFYRGMLLISNILRIIAISILYLFVSKRRKQYNDKINDHLMCIKNLL